ncbi:MAG: radical SAM protein, partial [Gemmatimonadales bacterium]
MRHLYIHVPFCRRRCVYCDFAVAVRKEVPARRYMDAVLKEHSIKRERERWNGEPLVTLYLGGGTPSLLAAEQTERLVAYMLDVERADCAHPDYEVTIEANPDDVTEHTVGRWIAAGVTRVSL